MVAATVGIVIFALLCIAGDADGLVGDLWRWTRRNKPRNLIHNPAFEVSQEQWNLEANPPEALYP